MSYVTIQFESGHVKAINFVLLEYNFPRKNYNLQNKHLLLCILCVVQCCAHYLDLTYQDQEDFDKISAAKSVRILIFIIFK